MWTMSALAVTGVLCLGAQQAQAQSGSSGARPQPMQQGSGSANQGSGGGSGSAMKQSKLAMRGYCPVALVQAKQWIKGSSQFAADFDGHRYYFVGAEPLALFQANPQAYAPVLGGDDVVTYAQSGQRVPGALEHGAVYEDRIYFFSSAANKAAFQSMPRNYASADLALGGDCVVCKVKMNQKMPGDPQITSMHNGVRFQFVGQQQQSMFLANPAEFTVAAGSGSRGSGSATHGSGSQGSARQQGSGSAASGSGGR